jgi:hypothetical protein
MLTELAGNHMNTAANPGCQWLFPASASASPSCRSGSVLRAADGLPAGEAAQLTITRSDRVRSASAVQHATAWAASSTGLL